MPGRGSRPVVVVGAGLAGLAAALQLRADGREVVVLEKEPLAGGRMGLLVQDSSIGRYHFDTGPGVLACPGLVEECFALVGAQPADYLELLPVERLLQARFVDGEVIDVYPDPQQTLAGLGDLVGAADRDGLATYLADVAHAGSGASRPARAGTGAALLDYGRALRAEIATPRIESYVGDERLRRLFNWTIVPGLATAYLAGPSGQVGRAVFPRGGMHRLPAALASAAIDAGVEMQLGSEVARLVRRDGVARAVVTTEGESIDCEAVILATDPGTAGALLERGTDLARPAASCWMLFAGGDFDLPAGASHLTVLFGRQSHLDAVDLDLGRLPSDPTILLNAPSLTDPSVAPPGSHTLSVVTATPNLGVYPSVPVAQGRRLVATAQDWGRIGDHYRRHIVNLLHARGVSGLDRADVQHVLTPVDWRARGLVAGSPFQVPRRWPPLLRLERNVGLAGAPAGVGSGVERALLSGLGTARQLLG